MADIAPAGADNQVIYWLEQIEASLTWHKKWHDRGKLVEERYLDKKDEEFLSTAHTMNVLWSNVQTIQPALYAKAPTPRVQRRFRDKDPVGKWGAKVLERAQAYELDAYDDDYHYRAAVLDYLLPGRGQVWVDYEPKFDAQQKLAWECTRVRHLNWKDFITNQARTWDEVARSGWVAKREALSEEECKAQRLNTEDLTFSDHKEAKPADTETGKIKKAVIWEIWDKRSEKIYFVSKSSPKLLRPAERPPLELEGFFPCPRPLTATTTTDSIIPVPDFCFYQNQADEIDRLTQKINLLTKALRVVGVYDSTAEALGDLLINTDNNAMIPCDNWAVFFGTKGLEGSVSFLPMKDIIETLLQSYAARDQAKQVMYEVMGIGDIIRGASDPNETARAQEIKAQWGGLRIRDRQKEVQRLIRDTFRIKAEFHAEKFQPTTLRAMSNVPLLDRAAKQQLGQRKQMVQKAQQFAQANPEVAQEVVQQNPQIMQMMQPLSLEEEQRLAEPAWEDVVELLKNQKLRAYTIDVETDSTVQADEEAEKTARNEFLTAATSFMTAMGPMVQQDPKLGPLAGAMLQFGARAFRADDLESEIEEYVEGLSQGALLPPQEQPADPKMQTEQLKGDVERERIGFDREKMGAEKETFGAEQQFKRDDMAFRREELTARQNEAGMKTQADLHKRAIEADEAIRVAEAARPKLEDAAPFKPMFEALQQGLMEGLGMLAQQIQQASEQQAQTLQAGLTQIAQLVAAPKDIAVRRGRDGKISGALATPQVAGNA